MADRNLVTYLEEQRLSDDTGWTGEWELTGYQIEIDRSAAGQPGILITITNALGEPSTIVVKDGLALFAPVLEWLLKDNGELNTAVAHSANIAGFAVDDVLKGLVAVAMQRMEADTTDDGSPVQ